MTDNNEVRHIKVCFESFPTITVPKEFTDEQIDEAITTALIEEVKDTGYFIWWEDNKS